MTVRDHLGLTALDVAEKADHEECMIVLRAAADKGGFQLLDFIITELKSHMIW